METLKTLHVTLIKYMIFERTPAAILIVEVPRLTHMIHVLSKI